jgi:hypothetical protein
MRLSSMSLVFVLASCGGSNKPADSPSADTSSLETKGATTHDDEPSAAAAPTAAPVTTPTPEKPDAPPPAPSHPAPAVTGSIDGKPFAPTLARVSSRMQKDGRLLVSIDDAADCSGSSDATLTMLVPWEDGYKVDLGSLKRSTKKAPGEIAFMRAAAAGGKKQLSATFKPSGTVTIVKAPTAEKALGKMKIDLQSGDYMLAGDLDILVCTTPK